ncbi:MAG: hypothetical protein AAFO91_00355 [Bacteroidota bacterium]
MNLIAKSCFCPGLISLLSNLIKSVDNDQLGANQKEWVNEYLTGLEHEMYRVELNEKFYGQDFTEISVAIYE